MAPEQIRDAAQVDARADVFSLGAILYELVTGQRAFVGDDTFELFAAITGADFVPPRQLAPDLSESMERAILGALEVDPALRTPSCDALLEAWTGSEISLTERGPWDHAALERVASLRSADSIDSVAASSDETWSADSFELDVSEEPGAPREATSPSPPAGWLRYGRALGVGLVGAVPFLFGVLVVVFGSVVVPLTVGGPLMGLVLFFGLISLGLPLVLGLREADGLPVVLGWYIGPGLAALCGSFGTWAGLENVKRAVESASLDQVSQLAALGSSIALTTDVGGLSIAAVGCAVGAVTLAYSFSSVAGPILARGKATLALALVGGTLLWLVRPFLGGGDIDAPGGFFVFLVLLAGGGSCAFLASNPSDVLRRSRWIAGSLTVAGVSAACRAVELQAQLTLAQELRDTVHVVDQVVAAESFTAIATDPAALSSFAWPLLALAVAAIPVSSDRRFTVPVRSLVAPVLLLAVVMVSRVVTNQSLEDTISIIVPAGMSLATRTELGVELVDLDAASAPDWAPAGMEAVWAPEHSAIREGDIVIAVAGRPIHSVRDLLGAVRACECGQDDACDLVASCLKPGASVSFTVTRRVEDRATNLERSVSLPLGDLSAGVSVAPEPDPFDELVAIVGDRPIPLVIAVAGLAGAGVEEGTVQGLTLRLRTRLRELPNTHVVEVEGHDWKVLLEEQSDTGVALILLGSLGGVGSERLLSLERVDVGPGLVTFRSHREAPTMDALAAQLDEMLLDLLAGKVAATERDVLNEIVGRYAGTVQFCYEKALADAPTLEGRVVMTWTVLASGRVAEIEVVEDDTGHERLLACLKRGVGRFLFPPGLGGTVRYPFRFSP